MNQASHHVRLTQEGITNVWISIETLTMMPFASTTVQVKAFYRIFTPAEGTTSQLSIPPYTFPTLKMLVMRRLSPNQPTGNIQR